MADLVSSSFTSAQRFVPIVVDPLVLDLDGDGLETLGVNAGVLFDHDGDGIRTGTGWISPDDGFLALDRNGNGRIDSGRELFGDSTPLLDAGGSEIGRAADGFAALAQEDSNNDGVVDAKDANWSRLRVWRDSNRNGISEAGELQTMAQAGIVSLSVVRTRSGHVQTNGNVITDTGFFTRVDGSTGQAGIVGDMADVNLASDTFRRKFMESVPLTETARNLPEMHGSGVVRDLRQAVSLNTSEGRHLAALLDQYAKAGTRAGQLELLDDVLRAWAATGDLAAMPERAAGRGYGFSSNLTDEQLSRLTVLERFNGRSFYRLPGEQNAGAAGVTGMAVTTDAAGRTQVQVNMSSAQLSLLDRAWQELRNSVYDGLLLQTRLKPYADSVQANFTENGFRVDAAALDALFAARYAQAPLETVADMLDLRRVLGADLASLGWNGTDLLRSWVAGADETLRGRLKELFAEMGSVLVLGGTEADAIRTGPENDMIFGEAGDDYIWAGGDDDTITGGTGNDDLRGGAGNDTYIFGRGDGKDVIWDDGYETEWIVGNTEAGTADVLQFGAGITADDIIARRDGKDLLLGLKEAEKSFDELSDVVRIRHWNHKACRIEKFRMFNGTEVSEPALSTLLKDAPADGIALSRAIAPETAAMAAVANSLDSMISAMASFAPGAAVVEHATENPADLSLHLAASPLR